MITIIGGRRVADATPPTPDFRGYARSSPSITRMYAADGTLMGEFAKEWRQITPYEKIPKTLVNAFIAIEDHDFWIRLALRGEPVHVPEVVCVYRIHPENRHAPTTARAGTSTGCCWSPAPVGWRP